MGKTSLFACAMLLVATVFPCLPAVERIGIFIGCDQGLPHEKPLKYASHDAASMAKLLGQLGHFERDRTYLQTNQSLGRLSETMREVAGRIKEIRRSGNELLLLFYYSGHGSSKALHIRSNRLPREKLMAMFDSLDADFSLCIIDACESGDFLRQKGAKLIETPHRISREELHSKGTVILSSSASGELSHESESYKGAVFSHHLMNGLRGMADFNNDASISLLEMYTYASVSTRMEKSFGQPLAQNPAYDFDMVGHSDVVLTSMQLARSQIIIGRIPSGYLDIHNAGTMELAARVCLKGNDSVSFQVPANKYVLTYLDKEGLNVCTVDLTWNRVARINQNDFIRRPNLTLYAKGGKGMLFTIHGLMPGVRFADPVSGGRVWFPDITYNLRTYAFVHSFSLGYSRVQQSNAAVGLSNDMYFSRFSYSLKKPIVRFVYGQILAGGEVGYHYLHQEINDIRFQDQPPVIAGDSTTLPLHASYQANVYQTGIPLEVELFLPLRLCISLKACASGYAYKNQATSRFEYRFTYEPAVACGILF